MNISSNKYAEYSEIFKKFNQGNDASFYNDKYMYYNVVTNL